MILRVWKKQARPHNWRASLVSFSALPDWHKIPELRHNISDREGKSATVNDPCLRSPVLSRLKSHNCLLLPPIPYSLIMLLTQVESRTRFINHLWPYKWQVMWRKLPTFPLCQSNFRLCFKWLAHAPLDISRNGYSMRSFFFHCGYTTMVIPSEKNYSPNHNSKL